MFTLLLSASSFTFFFFFFKQKTAYEMRISDWSSDVCSSDLLADAARRKKLGSALETFAGEPRDHQKVAQGFANGLVIVHDRRRPAPEIGRASCRERVCQYV